MRAVRRTIGALVILAVLAIAALLVVAYGRRHPGDVPWPPLRLADPIGHFTVTKLAALGEDPRQCRGILDDAGVRFVSLPPRTATPPCGYRNAVRLRTAGPLDIAWRPAGLGTSCPVAAALAKWEWDVVQPAAQRHFGTKVTAIDHFGSYNCRVIGGRTGDSREGRRWSEHATANAIDVAGFRLANGRRITIAGDWRDEPDAAFLHDVRDGACRLFATVLSPDYNAAHRDHLHFDQAQRGAFAGGYCR